MSTIAPRTTEQIRVDANVLERVKKGYALLQEKHGEDWVDHIDLRKLDLSSGTCCVLGQLYENDYSKGAAELFGGSGQPGADRSSREHGFLADHLGEGDEYEQLDEIWKALIEQHFGREVELIAE